MTPENARRDRDEMILPWEAGWDAPRTNPFLQVLDNVAETRTLIYGPHGETLVRQEPRPVGFRKP